MLESISAEGSESINPYSGMYYRLGKAFAKLKVLDGFLGLESVVSS